eukprot:127500_1
MSYHSPRVVRANIFEAVPNNNNQVTTNNNNAAQPMNMSGENIGNATAFNYMRGRPPVPTNNNANTLSPAQFNRPSTYNSSQFVASRDSQRHFSQRGRAYISPRNPRPRRAHTNPNNTNTKSTQPFSFRQRINNININNGQYVVSPKARNYIFSTPKAPHPPSMNTQTPFVPPQTQPNNNNFAGYNRQNMNNNVTQTVANVSSTNPLKNITNTTSNTENEEVIDLTATMPMDVPPLVDTSKDEDNDDNMTVASSLSPILSPNKTAKRSFPSFESMSMNHSMANFEINHHTQKEKKKKKKKKASKKKEKVRVRRHCYNTRSNKFRETDPIDVDSDSSSSDNDSSSSDSSPTSSSSDNTISSLWQSIDFADPSVEIPALIVSRGMCPIKGCSFKRKFKNAQLMKQHICNIHVSSNWPLICFLCKLCQTLYAEKQELEHHAKVVHHNADGVCVLLNIFSNFCNNAFEIRCPEFHKCNQRFMVTKQAKSHLRDAHNYHFSDILECKLPYYVSLNYQCILNDHCKGKVFACYNDCVAHLREWHFVKKPNAIKIANILRYKLINHLDANYKEFMKTWKEMMTKDGFLNKTKVIANKTRGIPGNNTIKSVSPYSAIPIQGVNQSNIEIPTRAQCRAALRTGIQIDNVLQSNNNSNMNHNAMRQIDKITDLIMFGCHDDGGLTNLTLQELHCLQLNDDGSKKYNGDYNHYSQVVDHYFSKHIQNQTL